MSRENGGVVGAKNIVTINNAVGVFNVKTHFVNNQASAWPRSGSLFIGISHNSTPYISIYPFSSLGFGAKLSDPSTLPTSTGNGVAFAPNGRMVATAHLSSPYMTLYPFSGGGFGTKISDPGTLPGGTGQGVVFNPSSNTIILAGSGTPYLSAYPIDSITGFGTKYSNPATIPSTTCASITFAPNGNDVVAGLSTSATINVYPWSNGFGTKYSDPAAGFPSTMTSAAGVKFNPAGNVIFVVGNNSTVTSGNRIEIAYPFTSGVGFGAGSFDTTGLSVGNLNASTAGGSDANDVSVHPTGNDVAIGVTSAGSYGRVRMFTFNSSTGYTGNYSAPATDAAGGVNGVAFSPDGNYIASAHNTTPYITIWPWTTGTGYGTKFTNPATLPPNIGNGIAWGVV
jgi:WD40 repeat protein